MNKIISLGLIIGLTVVSCTDPESIGLEIQPVSDNIVISSANFTSMSSRTVSEDSLRTDETLNLILGEINDPIFGFNKGSFYTHILLTENNNDLGSNPVVDSVVLSYTYSGYYGNLEDFTSLDVVEIQDDIYKDSTYYSSSYPAPIPGGVSFVESFSISDDTASGPMLRMKLSNDFGQSILDLGEDNLKDNETFLEQFKGLAVTASAQNMLLYLNANGSNSFLKVYYHNDSTTTDTLSLNFELGGDAARISLFNEKEEPIIINDVNNNYLQSMAGYKTNIVIENTDSLADMLAGKAVNKVTMRFDIEQGSLSDYKAHDKLFLVRVNEEGKNVFLSDYTVEGETHFGGVLKDDSYYEFNITRYFYQLLNNDAYTKDLYLLPAGSAANANRTILGKEIKLNIYYSEL